jgi:hypothetical protein
MASLNTKSIDPLEIGFSPKPARRQKRLTTLNSSPSPSSSPPEQETPSPDLGGNLSRRKALRRF